MIICFHKSVQLCMRSGKYRKKKPGREGGKKGKEKEREREKKNEEKVLLIPHNVLDPSDNSLYLLYSPSASAHKYD